MEQTKDLGLVVWVGVYKVVNGHVNKWVFHDLGVSVLDTTLVAST